MASGMIRKTRSVDQAVGDVKNNNVNIKRTLCGQVFRVARSLTSSVEFAYKERFDHEVIE